MIVKKLGRKIKTDDSQLTLKLFESGNEKDDKVKPSPAILLFGLTGSLMEIRKSEARNPKQIPNPNVRKGTALTWVSDFGF